MTRKDFLERHHLAEIRLDPKLVEAEFKPGDGDRRAAWALWVRLSAVAPRFSWQSNLLLELLNGLFPAVQEILTAHGPDCREFTILSLAFLRQVVEPVITGKRQLKAGEYSSICILLGRPKPSVPSGGDVDRPGPPFDRQFQRWLEALADMAGVDDCMKLNCP